LKPDPCIQRPKTKDQKPNTQDLNHQIKMAANNEHIRLNIDNRVARVTFAHPPLNIFNITMMKEIVSALGGCSGQDLIAIVFDADKDCRAFSAGVAVEEHVEQTIYQMLDSFHSIFRVLEQLAKPTIALVDGAALGGGCEFVAACDIVIAGERARFGQPEIKLGVFPPVAAIILPLVIGDKRARELILTGEVIDAVEAARLGLANYVVPSSHLEQKAAEVLSRLRELSSSSLELTRRALDVGRGRTLDEALKQIEDIYLHELMKSADAREGIRAFMEKRKPVWRNR
jgi:cyclohexa-1,5-dienecarbonyl-CoA hydratase